MHCKLVQFKKLHLFKICMVTYGYRTSRLLMVKHIKTKYDYVTKNILKKFSSVLDIGSNDGTLNFFPKIKLVFCMIHRQKFQKYYNKTSNL